MLREQAASGLSVREWCLLQNDLSVKSFYYRRKQVRSMVLHSDRDPVFTEIVIPQANDGGYNISSETEGFTAQLTISRGDLSIGVNQDTPRQLIADVLEVIRHA